MKSFGSKPWILPQPVLIVGTKVVLRECPLCVSDAAEFFEEHIKQ